MANKWKNPPKETEWATIEEIKFLAVLTVLRDCGWNQTKASEILGISARNIRGYYLKRLKERIKR